MYERFLRQITDFIFVETPLKPADVIFIPGNGYPQMAERAAGLWREGMAPYALPSGKFSILSDDSQARWIKRNDTGAIMTRNGLFCGTCW